MTRRNKHAARFGWRWAGRVFDGLGPDPTLSALMRRARFLGFAIGWEVVEHD